MERGSAQARGFWGSSLSPELGTVLLSSLTPSLSDTHVSSGARPPWHAALGVSDLQGNLEGSIFGGQEGPHRAPSSHQELDVTST